MTFKGESNDDVSVDNNNAEQNLLLLMMMNSAIRHLEHGKRGKMISPIIQTLR